jgi:uncharacterized protein involved in exopolysaccharide biosynthesis
MIQRYELELYDTEAGCDFHKSDNGDLCKYEDAQKLEQENERLKAQHKNLCEAHCDLIEIEQETERENERLRDELKAIKDMEQKRWMRATKNARVTGVSEGLKETGE